MASVRISAPVHPTENPSAIDQAIRSIFPDAVLSFEHRCISGTASSLSRLAEVISNHRIRDSARAVLLRNVKGNSCRFHLSKQAATVGKASFTDGDSVLGDIEVTMESEDILAAIDSVARSTRLFKSSEARE
ncbi:MAG: RNA-binding domain-containing protein [Methanobacteriota archaeon]